ncbi:MAG: 50S ribosomal protein L29 [Candidatus Sungbacteria bacterium]|nr:50S ribosomal protein L29 [Candidatus Sungbacteria bacterium]
MKMREIREKRPEELKLLLAEQQKRLEEVRFGSEGRKMKNVKEAKLVRQSIARILTHLHNM